MARNKEQSDIARKLIDVAKTHPEYDASITKAEVTQLLDMAYTDRGPIKDLFALYQDVSSGKSKPGSENKFNSLLAYLLGITTKKPDAPMMIEPRRTYARDGFPDVDIDICYERRDEVVEHIINRYGRDKVANIGNIGKLKVSSAVRRAIKALDPTNSCTEENGWGKKIPGKSPNFQLENDICDTLPLIMKKEDGTLVKNLQEAYEEYPGFKEYMDKYPKVFEYAKAIEDVTASFGRHAGGFVLSPIPMERICPLHVTKRAKGDVDLATQFTMSDVESLGLIKMDLLGLSTETAIDKTIKMVQNNYGIPIDRNNLPENDKETLALCNSGHTIGCFQLENNGMQDTLRTIGVDTFDDITVCIAIFRPGPLQYIQEYADRKKGNKVAEHSHPLMKKITASTQGIILYQEQTMRAFVDLAGLTESEGYTFVKMCAKKKRSLISEMEDKFVRGCLKNSISKDVVGSIWQDLERFSKYAFNSSHAVSYARKAFCTAYLKAHFPTEFMVSRLSVEYLRKSEKHMKDYRREVLRMGYKILPPDINKSTLEWQIAGDKTLLEPLIVKNIGAKAAKDIVAHRPYDGQDVLYTFARRVGPAVNTRVVEAMCDAGMWSGRKKQDVITSFEKIRKDAKKGVGGKDLFL